MVVGDICYFEVLDMNLIFRVLEVGLNEVGLVNIIL